MRITQVEMLMWYRDKYEMANMMRLLTNDEKFLFDHDKRVEHGYAPEGGIGWSWPADDVNIQMKCQTGPYIDFRFTLNFHAQPHHLIRTLNRRGWKIKSKFRFEWNFEPDDSPEWQPIGAWQDHVDPDFPLWNMKSDALRQTRPRGRAGLRLLLTKLDNRHLL